MSGEVGCCSVGCGTLVGVSVFCIMCSELLIMSDISCPLWLLLLLFAFQSMFISVWVSRLEIVEFPDDVCRSVP